MLICCLVFCIVDSHLHTCTMKPKSESVEYKEEDIFPKVFKSSENQAKTCLLAGNLNDESTDQSLNLSLIIVIIIRETFVFFFLAKNMYTELSRTNQIASEF